MVAADAVVAGVQTQEPVIAFSPVLGKKFGVCAALLIQQIHYWTQISGKSYAGEQWCYNTYEAWAQQLGVYAAETIRQEVKKLEANGVLVIGCFNKHKYDRTKWYRVNYSGLCSALTAGDKEGRVWKIRSHPSDQSYRIHLVSIGPPVVSHPLDQSYPIHPVSSVPPIPETNS